MYGVSPAYFISRFGQGFSLAEVHDALPDLKQCGFDAFQPEVYLEERLGEWQSGAKRLGRAAREQGLHTQQFVAHFLMHHFGNASALRSSALGDLTSRVVEVVLAIGDCPAVVVPIPGYETDTEEHSSADALIDARRLTTERIAAMLEIVEPSGLRLGLEILPGSLIDGSDGFLSLASEIGSSTIGLCLDTGHAWASHEDVAQIPAKMGDRIVGTHLCDNDGDVNTSWRPGTGTIEWDDLVGALLSSAYSGSWDIEIGCAAEHVESEYREALAFLRRARNFHEAPTRPTR
ncbi:MAG: sugar phosphate isomerase/epimerase family protein [Spirochaetota bacterium]